MIIVSEICVSGDTTFIVFLEACKVLSISADQRIRAWIMISAQSGLRPFALAVI